MKTIRVMITGAGSVVGQGILKALRTSKLPLRLIAADIHPLNTALYRAHEAILFPKVEERNSLEKILEILKVNKINVVMVGSEFDLIFFAKHRELIRKKIGCCVIASPLPVVQLANDKWKTAEFLRKNNLPFAKSYIPGGKKAACLAAKKLGYPLVLKPRSGTSSRGVHFIKNQNELLWYFDRIPYPLLQEILGDKNKKMTELSNEFTCSLFRSKDGTLFGPFSARRSLRAGVSWVAEVDSFPELHSLLFQIAEKIPFEGAFNIQLMNTSAGPVPFEFNARFSGTTAVRAHFGFNEPEMAIRSFYLGEILKLPVIRKGLAFRYTEEVFLDNLSEKELFKPWSGGKVERWF